MQHAAGTLSLDTFATFKAPAKVGVLLKEIRQRYGLCVSQIRPSCFADCPPVITQATLFDALYGVHLRKSYHYNTRPNTDTLFYPSRGWNGF